MHLLCLQNNKINNLSSQGSAVTRLRSGEQCNKNFVANLLPNSTAKKFENRLICARVMDRNTEVPFLTHSTAYVCHFLYFISSEWGNSKLQSRDHWLFGETESDVLMPEITLLVDLFVTYYYIR